VLKRTLQEIKVFCFFFSKKKKFLPLLSGRPALARGMATDEYVFSREGAG
jgi:hypothetical protein